MLATTSLMPPADALDIERISTLQRRRSAKRVYMRKRSAANSAASSPPVPARISRRMFFSSLGSFGSSRILQALLQPLLLAGQLALFLARHVAHLGILLHLARLVDALAELAVLAQRLDQLAQVRVLLGELLHRLAVAPGPPDRSSLPGAPRTGLDGRELGQQQVVEHGERPHAAGRRAVARPTRDDLERP